MADSPAVPATTDLCDAHEDLLESGVLRVVQPPSPWVMAGQRARFAGPVVTLRCHEDNAWVRAALEQPGEGRVLVVDGGGSQRCALLGGQLGVLAQRNQWAGVVIQGCLRDYDELDACAVGIRALGVSPRRSRRTGGAGSARDIVIDLCGVRVAPGDWLYADRDGVLVCSQPLS